MPWGPTCLTSASAAAWRTCGNRSSTLVPACPTDTWWVTARPRSGAAVRGVRVSEDAFWVHIRDTSGRLHAFRVGELAELQREAGASLMPAYALSVTELDDLVAYLASLRGQR